ncbi:conserved hypothetical protein [Ricinus communis]|uniref:Uncharacterized protein n=1 Tax=Ricinus communis TaxID=3988 RepID=B9SFR5_RICCO|nr:conserved hypothetical protein [Ricinus communis]
MDGEPGVMVRDFLHVGHNVKDVHGTIGLVIVADVGKEKLKLELFTVVQYMSLSKENTSLSKDFNKIIWDNKRRGGKDRNFHDDAKCRGNRDHLGIMERLDRVLGDDAWSNLFPNYGVLTLTRANSNHALVICDGEYMRVCCMGRNEKVGRFEAHWVKRDNCVGIVKDGYISYGSDTTRISGYKRIHGCMQSLMRWNKLVVGDIKVQLLDLQS